MHISFVEYGVFNYPENMEDYRLYRVEYWRDADTFAFHEDTIWLPEEIDISELEDFLNKKIQENKK